ncbi:hypothetical protein QYF61_000373 [Mycteria americana]|uniref:Rna-directed dna polymerase from mobile element jockey-like n=1 Tax=Mycteria americana TaxID=33587 RepID=A0AAN7SAM1_MYCAM|nr:hypothetical protein QYF61_000373 [Mycteria americana]
MLKVSTQMQQGNLCTFMQISDDTKLGGVVDRPDACTAIQRDADKMEKWADKNLLESSFAKDLGILVDTKLNMSQQRSLVAKAANSLIGCIRKKVAESTVEMHLEHYVLVLGSPVQQKHTGIMTGQEAIGQTEIHKISFKYKENVCTVRVTEHWHRLPREVVESPSLEILRTQLDTALGNPY